MLVYRFFELISRLKYSIRKKEKILQIHKHNESRSMNLWELKVCRCIPSGVEGQTSVSVALVKGQGAPERNR